MLFNSLNFLLYFSAFLVLYYSAKRNLRLWIMLLGSYLFYGWWDWRFLGLTILLTLVNYLAGLGIAKRNANPGYRKTFLAFAIVTSLTILGFFKYFDFFVESFVYLLRIAGLNAHLGTLSIVLPIGISFYTFKALTYPIDLYRNSGEVEKSLLRFSVFVAFFPQLLAGPIQKASTFLPQLKHDHPLSYKNLTEGIRLIAWGFVLKSVLADSLAPVVDEKFLNPLSQNPLSMLIGVVFYAFQIYGDFAGYSFIAIGTSRLIGIQSPKNFDRPYFSSSFSEFWRRWHISLSSWLRDYLYIPLGGNRKGRVRTQINLMSTMLLCGLWHGASWTFVGWGCLHGLYLAGQRFLNAVVPPLRDDNFLLRTGNHLISILICFVLTCIAWVFFRSQDFGISISILNKLTHFDDYSFSAVTQKFHVIKGLILIALIYVLEAISFKVNMDDLASRRPSLFALSVTCALLLISLMGTFGNNSFIYFRF